MTWSLCGGLVDFVTVYFILHDAQGRKRQYRYKEEDMLYFVKEKDNSIHQYPVPKRCGVAYEHEQLRDTVPHGVAECPYCMREWPDSKG